MGPGGPGVPEDLNRPWFLPVGVGHRSSRSPGGWTLVEVLVAVAAVGLISASVGVLFTAMTGTLRATDSRSRILENLSLAAERIAGDLRDLARTNPTVSGARFHLVGIDEDGTFENRLSSSHASVATARHNWDRLHLHVLDPDIRLSGSCGSGGVCSERVYHAYWINGPGSTNTVSGFRDGPGLARRRIRHKTPGETLPLLNGSRSPVFSLDNTDGADRTGAGPVAFRIDYVSFRYFDPASSRWVNCWDTTGSAPRPSSCRPPSANRLPAAVQFALRGYDPRDDTSRVPPLWYETTVDLR